jgi:transcription elongation factor GreA
MSPEATIGTSTSETSSAVSAVGCARVHLLGRARVQRERGCACGDELRPQLETRPRAVAQSSAHLHRDGHVDRRRNRLDDPARAQRVLEQRRARARLRHLPDRAAEVDVDQVGARRDDHAGRFTHGRGIGAEQLDGERMLVGGDAEVAERALVAVLDARAADHLRAHETGSEAPSLAAKGLHADAGHRREHEACGDLHVPDRPRLAQADRHVIHRSGAGLTAVCHVATMRVRVARRRPRFFSPDSTEAELHVKDVILTPHGYETLKQELDHLRTTRRREVAERIRVAREFGDIAENAEYDDAKNEQAMLEHKIAQLEERIAHARVIDKREVDTSVVSVGSVVRLRDLEAKQTVEYHIVGSAEANPAEQKLSNESPVGKAILGHKKGETVEVLTPRGSKLKFKIMEIKAA